MFAHIVFSVFYTNSDNETSYITENSVSRGIPRYYISSDAKKIQATICIYASFKCMNVEKELDQHKSVTTPISDSFSDILKHYVDSNENKFHDGYFWILLKNLNKYFTHSQEFAKIESLLLQQLSEMIRQCGSIFKAQVVEEYSEVLNSILSPLNSHLFIENLDKSRPSESLLKLTSQILKSELFEEFFGNPDISNTKVMSFSKKVISTLLNITLFTPPGSTLQNDIIETISQIYKNMRKAIENSDIYAEPFDYSDGVVSSKIHPFYYSNYRSQDDLKITQTIALNQTYGFDFTFAVFGEFTSTKIVLVMDIIDNTENILSIDQDIVKVASFHLVQNEKPKIQRILFRNITISVPLTDLNYDFTCKF